MYTCLFSWQDWLNYSVHSCTHSLAFAGNLNLFRFARGVTSSSSGTISPRQPDAMEISKAQRTRVPPIPPYSPLLTLGIGTDYAEASAVLHKVSYLCVAFGAQRWGVWMVRGEIISTTFG